MGANSSGRVSVTFWHWSANCRAAAVGMSSMRQQLLQNSVGQSADGQRTERGRQTISKGNFSRDLHDRLAIVFQRPLCRFWRAVWKSRHLLKWWFVESIDRVPSGRPRPADWPTISSWTEVAMPDGLVGRIPRAATRPVPARGPRRRCRLCDRRLGPGNINYVGQTTRSVVQRVYREHARATANEIEKSNVNDDSPHRPMYQLPIHCQSLPKSTAGYRTTGCLPAGDGGHLPAHWPHWKQRRPPLLGSLLVVLSSLQEVLLGVEPTLRDFEA